MAEPDSGSVQCDHPGEAVYWNPGNHVVQCHRCGERFGPSADLEKLRNEMVDHVTVQVTTLAQYINELRDWSLVWSEHIQRLESLPGVSEALAARAEAEKEC